MAPSAAGSPGGDRGTEHSDINPRYQVRAVDRSLAVLVLLASTPAGLEASAVAAGKSYKKMVSRAYHDSLFMARIAPIAMLFIPCRGGISHRPDEYASPEWIGAGVHVLARTLATLAS